ncbi:thiamine-phosphate kinase [Nocardioides zeae]|uniref:Thiamine-monophosphate kinase n=1 Tax=Nocardioides imazamoxiresistens TaxID=3231893 RepID=A0ABU3PXL7_9ACTN|nr:thiamine-phosphate kinase [Nocardioides zeae]MDT9593909.1 thiamine-phosphate kinase [Nocardioides zeae]
MVTSEAGSGAGGTGAGLLADVGEDAVVATLLERFAALGPAAGEPDDVLVGPGDDAAVLRVRRGHAVVSTDLLVEDRHFRRDWCSATDVGHRAAAQNLSDINAMGGRAHSLTLGLALPSDLPLAWVREFADGFATEAARVGARVVGGDVTGGDQVVVAVTVLGTVAKAPVLRSGARPGDVVALCGRQGWAAGGLAVLGRGFRSPRVLVEAYRRPEPPYAAGPAAAEAGATALVDVSDGLLSDAGHVAQASGVRIDLRTADLEVAEPLHAVGSALGADPLRFVLTGGDDHPLLGTFPAGATLPEGWRAVGAVHELRVDDTSAVTVDGEVPEGDLGWRHF